MKEHIINENDTFVIKRSLDCGMLVEPVIYADDSLMEPLFKEITENKANCTISQLVNAASLPSVVKLTSLPDIHYGFCFPIGTAIAFDLDDPNCIVSVSGVGHDINCGVRSVATNLNVRDIKDLQQELADELFRNIPAGFEHSRPSHLKNSPNGKAFVQKLQNDKKCEDSNEGGSDNEKTIENIIDESLIRDPDFTKETLTKEIQKTNLELVGLTDIDLPFLNNVLEEGVEFLVSRGIVNQDELDYIEDSGRMEADSKKVCQKAKSKGISHFGTLGSGNHYLEIQRVTDIYDSEAAEKMNINSIGQIIITIHCGSRGLGYQICEDFKRKIKMDKYKAYEDSRYVDKNNAQAIYDAQKHTFGKQNAINDEKGAERINNTPFLDEDTHKKYIHTENKHLFPSTFDLISKTDASMELKGSSKEVFSNIYTKADSKLGRDYLEAMGAASNFAFCNRAIIDAIARKTLSVHYPDTKFNLIYDVCHNIAKKESHVVDGKLRNLLVHRKGASRAYSPFSNEVPEKYKEIGQPVLVGGSMGTCSYILTGDIESNKTLGSACHGAGRLLSRIESKKKFTYQEIVDLLKKKNIVVKCASQKEFIEEAPGSYKNVDCVVDICEKHRIARKIVRVEPFIVIKG